MNSKQAKLPEITEDTKLLSFDLESNGLHGEAFAVSGVVMDSGQAIVDEFNARIKIESDVDEWVQENVLPKLTDMQITHGSYGAMCDAFWRWFVTAQTKADYVVVSNGYPVEYKFLLDCQQLNLEERYWQHPFPIIDVTSLLLLLKKTHGVEKKAISQTANKAMKYRPHHPLDDAKKAAIMAFEAFKIAGRLR